MQGMVPLYGFGGVPYSAVRKAAPRNLLDNSDFTNPVNQRGQTSYTGAVYAIDRWKTYGSTDKTVTIDNGILLPAGIYDWGQPIPNSVFTAGKTYTFAVMTDIGRIGIESITYEGAFKQTANQLGDTGLILNAIYMWTSDITLFALQNTSTADVRIIWAALYEGEYTAETLPEYRCKGYENELFACQYYYQNHKFMQYQTISTAYQGLAYCFMQFPLYRNMRGYANVTQTGGAITLGTGTYTFSGSFSADTTTAMIGKNYESISNPAGACYCYTPDAAGVTIELSADL